jgi:hypothetical protein
MLYYSGVSDTFFGSKYRLVIILVSYCTISGFYSKYFLKSDFEGAASYVFCMFYSINISKFFSINSIILIHI